MFKFLGRSSGQRDPKRELRRVLGKHSLPSFSSVVLDTLEKLRDPEATPVTIGETVSADPGLSVRLLSTVNSAAYALRREVRSVEHAIAMLGIPTVESLVISAAVGETVPSGSQRGYEHRRFWRAAARRAAAARALAALLHPAGASESFTAALLQDMAIPFLATGLSSEYGPVLEAWHSGGDGLNQLEQEQFGWDHAEIGKWLGLDWNLPEGLATMIGSHHDPGCRPAVYLVSFIGETDGNLGIDRLIETAEERYGLDAKRVEGLVGESFRYAEDLTRHFTGE